jgi:hypothetical protein
MSIITLPRENRRQATQLRHSYHPDAFYRQNGVDLFDLLLKMVRTGHPDARKGCAQAHIRASRPEPSPNGPFSEVVPSDTPLGIWAFSCDEPEASDCLIVVDLVNVRIAIGIDAHLVSRFATDAHNDNLAFFDHDVKVA